MQKCYNIIIIGKVQDIGVIADFLKEIKDKGFQKGAVIENITTDELSEISRKLDKGIDILKDIKKDTSSLPQIKDILNSFVLEQREHNQWMKEHNQNLEKILEKLAQR